MKLEISNIVYTGVDFFTCQIYGVYFLVRDLDMRVFQTNILVENLPYIYNPPPNTPPLPSLLNGGFEQRLRISTCNDSDVPLLLHSLLLNLGSHVRRLSCTLDRTEWKSTFSNKIAPSSHSATMYTTHSRNVWKGGFSTWHWIKMKWISGRVTFVNMELVYLDTCIVTLLMVYIDKYTNIGRTGWCPSDWKQLFCEIGC